MKRHLLTSSAIAFTLALVFLGMRIVETFDLPHECYSVVKTNSKHLKYETDANEKKSAQAPVKTCSVTLPHHASSIQPPFAPFPAVHVEAQKATTTIVVSQLAARAPPLA